MGGASKLTNEERKQQAQIICFARNDIKKSCFGEGGRAQLIDERVAHMLSELKVLKDHMYETRHTV